IALLSDQRIVMGGGCIRDLIVTDEAERVFANTVGLFDDALTRWREVIRLGGRLGREESAQAKKLAALAEEVMA
ncbi:MAG TPA: ABC transporter ATP-binding protein, partial [Candidatus Sumerlaeota bacterium]|nr:ABC transporter ATP-binding protein [Candidatus Sumerlaeota bacterium]